MGIANVLKAIVPRLAQHRPSCSLELRPSQRPEINITEAQGDISQRIDGALNFLPAHAQLRECLANRIGANKRQWRAIKNFLATHHITHLAQLGRGSYSNAFLTNSGHVLKIGRVDKHHPELSSRERSHPAILAPIDEAMLGQKFFIQLVPRLRILEDKQFDNRSFDRSNGLLRDELLANGMKAWDNHEGNYGLLPDNTLVWIDGGGVEKAKQPSGDQPDSSPWLTETGAWRQHEFFPEIQAGEITNIITAQDLENWGVPRDSNLAIAILDYGLQGDDLLAVLGDDTMAKPFTHHMEHGIDYLNIEDNNENRAYVDYTTTKKNLAQSALNKRLRDAICDREEVAACRLLLRGAALTLADVAQVIWHMDNVLQLALQLNAINLDAEIKNSWDRHSMPILLFAAKHNPKAALSLLAAGADINVRNPDGGFLLHAVVGAFAHGKPIDKLVEAIRQQAQPLSITNLEQDLPLIAERYDQETADYFRTALLPPAASIARQPLHNTLKL